MDALHAYFGEKRIVVCCGSGGVGKTTTAAALALAAAAEGLKVLVCTIDPAKRLANSLGLSELGNDARQVPEEKMVEAGVRLRGSLWAMMLDTKRTFDDLVDRYAPSADVAERIKANILYQNISTALAGSQEYMAMEKLHQLHLEGAYDLIVLDTPPTRHALDFLDAPKRMTAFLDGSVLQWFLKPYFGVAGRGMRAIERGAKAVLAAVEKVTGLTVLKVVSEFFISFEGMYEGFKERAAEVSKILKSKVTVFLLVTSPEDLTIEEAIFFYEKLKEYRMPFGGFIVNKVHEDYLARRGMKSAYIRWREGETAAATLAGLAQDAAEREAFLQLGDHLAENFENFERLAATDATSLKRLEDLSNAVEFVLPVPYFSQDIYDIQGLALMNAHLIGGRWKRVAADAVEEVDHG